VADEETRAGAGEPGLIVRMGDRSAILPLRHVPEVFVCGPVTPVPTAPEWLVGLTNHRGRLVPVLALERLAPKAGAPDGRALEPGPTLPNRVIPRVSVGDLEAALSVSAVGDVVQFLPDGSIVPGGGARTPWDGPYEVVDVPALLASVRDQLHGGSDPRARAAPGS
jgi:chemotaxis signal transduction protein